MLDLTISITTANNLELLRGLMESIEARTRKISYEVFVLISGSDDGSAEYLKSLPSVPTIIDNNPFPGYSQSHNIAIESGKGRYHLVMNDDMLLLTDTFDEVVELMDSNPEVGLAGCRLENEDGSLQYSAFSSYSGLWTEFKEIFLINTIARKFNRDLGSDYFGKYITDTGSSVPAAHLMGAFLMLRRECIEKAGMMDGDYFLSFEDQDLSYRVNHSGFEVRYFPGPKMLHYGNRVVGRLQRKKAVANLYTTRLLFHKKYFSPVSYIALIGIMFSGFSFRLLVATLSSLIRLKNPASDPECIRTWYGLLFLFGRIEQGL